VGYSRQIFAYSSNLQVNHIVSTIIYQAVLFPQNIQNANLGLLPVYISIYLCFNPTSLVPVEGIMTMIRANKTDHDHYPEWSPFGNHVVLDIKYMRNDSNKLGLSSAKLSRAKFCCIEVMFEVVCKDNLN